jgi:hypothetical protein
MQILESVNLQEQPNESGEAHTVKRNGRKQEGTRKVFIFFISVLFCHVCLETYDYQAENSNLPVTTLQYTTSEFLDSVCRNTKHFIVILLGISLGILALHYHTTEVYFENKFCTHNYRPQISSVVRSLILTETPVCKL